MYLDLRQIEANFRAYHNFEQSPDTQSGIFLGELIFGNFSNNHSSRGESGLWICPFDLLEAISLELMI